MSEEAIPERAKIARQLILYPFLAGTVTLFVLIYNSATDAWLEEASAYDDKYSYIFLNYFSVLRNITFKITKSDDGIISDALEALHRKAYQSGISKIPEHDGERLIWDYLFYLRPYQGGDVEEKNVNDLKKRQEIAEKITYQLPQATNFANVWMRTNRQELYIYHANQFLNFYGYSYSVTLDEVTKEIELAANLISSKNPPCSILNSKEKIGRMALAVHIFYISSAGVKGFWFKTNQSCKHPIVGNYINGRSAILSCFFPSKQPSYLQADQILKAREVETYEPAELILQERCPSLGLQYFLEKR